MLNVPSDNLLVISKYFQISLYFSLLTSCHNMAPVIVLQMFAAIILLDQSFSFTHTFASLAYILLQLCVPNVCNFTTLRGPIGNPNFLAFSVVI